MTVPVVVRRCGRARGPRASVLCLVAVALMAAPARPASAGVLTPGEWVRLQSGDIIVREQVLETAGRRYVGGASYVLVRASPERVAAVLRDVNAYRFILPRARSVRWIGLSHAGDPLVQIDQGTSWAHGSYTVRVHEERPFARGVYTVRFWSDRHFQSDIADADGFFQVEPAGEGRALLTYELMVDLGSGWVERLFERKVQDVALSTPLFVRRYVERLSALADKRAADGASLNLP